MYSPYLLTLEESLAQCEREIALKEQQLKQLKIAKQSLEQKIQVLQAKHD